MKVLIALALIGLFLSFGCVQDGTINPEGTKINESVSSQEPQTEKNETMEEVNMAKNPIIVFETEKGNFEAEIFVNEAPISGKNFVGLVEKKFYNGLTFHRVEPGFVVQGGDPNGDGTGGSDKTISLEIKPNLRHTYGTLGMARSQSPNSASSQFYVVTGEASFLDGQYAVFGKVLGNGMEVVEKIEIGDKMTKVYIKQ